MLQFSTGQGMKNLSHYYQKTEYTQCNMFGMNTGNTRLVKKKKKKTTAAKMETRTEECE